jgi:AcrR family transcriptional regulator
VSDTAVDEVGAHERPPGRPRSTVADQAIRDATVDLFAERGFEGFSVEDVADRAGVSKATVYRRYPSKVDLVVDAASCLTADEVTFPDTGNLRDDVHGLARSLVETFRTSPAGRVMPVMTFERRRYPELDAGYRRFLADRKARTRELLRRGIERGELPPDTDVAVMGGMLVGPIFYRLMITQEPMDDAFVDGLVDALLRGFGANVSPSASASG